MSIIYLDGADGTGKSTLANAFEDELKSRGVLVHKMHASYDNSWNMKQYHLNIINEAKTYSSKGYVVILDRLWLSELIYGTVYREGSQLGYNPKEIKIALDQASDNISTIVCMYRDEESAVSSHKNNVKLREEMFKDKMEVVNSMFMGAFYLDSMLDTSLNGSTYSYIKDEEGEDIKGFVINVLTKMGLEDTASSDSDWWFEPSVDARELDASHAWVNLIRDIMRDGDECSPRGMPIKELLEKTTKFNAQYPEVTVPSRKLGKKFRNAEAWWILAGRNDVASISPYSKHIGNYSNDGRFFDGAYGPRIVDQLRFISDTLFKDPDTRQAYIEIWRPNPRDSMDVPCTVGCQFTIRNGHLNIHDKMRSNDGWMGWVYDVFNFSMLGLYICLMLREKGLNVELGDIYLTSTSSHIYDRDWEAANEIVRSYDKSELVLGEGERFTVDSFSSPEDLLAFLEHRKDNPDTSISEWKVINGFATPEEKIKKGLEYRINTGDALVIDENIAEAINKSFSKPVNPSLNQTGGPIDPSKLFWVGEFPSGRHWTADTDNIFGVDSGAIK